MALFAIREDDERMRENEKLKGFEKMREFESKRKKEEKDVFVEKKKELWRIGIGEGDEENEEKEMVGNR